MLHGNSSMWMHNLLKQEESSMHRASRIYAAFHRDDVAVLSTWIQLHSQRQKKQSQGILPSKRETPILTTFLISSTLFTSTHGNQSLSLKYPCSVWCLLMQNSFNFLEENVLLSLNQSKVSSIGSLKKSPFSEHILFLEANFHLPWISDNSGRSKF